MLGRKGYLALVDPRMTQDYWEVWREETVALPIVLQRCTIHARASPNMFCGMVQELCEYLFPMVEEGDLFNMEMEIREGVRKVPMTTTPSKRAPSPMPGVEEPINTPAPNPPPTDLTLVPRRQPLPSPGISPLCSDDPAILPLEDVYGQGVCPWEPFWTSLSWSHYK